MASLPPALLLLCACSLLAGCCSNVSTDPRQDGLAGGLCGTATGAYAQRIDALKGQADDLDAANVVLRTSLSGGRRTVAELDRSISAKRRSLSQARNELTALRSRAARKQALVREIDGLLAEVAARERRVIAIETGMRSARNDTIRQEAARQAREIPVEDLLDSVRSLETSDAANAARRR